MKSKSIELKALRTILITYILLCIIIAGLNYGYASQASEETAKFIRWFWHFYENWVKTLFIIICSFLTLRIVGSSETTTMRKRNLIGFTVAALVVHIFGPLILNNFELYFFTMPLPWTTTSLQLLYENSSFYLSRFPIWGLTGITFALIFYICYSIIVILGTLLLGRRWQCSTLCLFNGFAAEVFDPAIPITGKKRKIKPRNLKLLSMMRWVFLIIAIIFTAYWVMFLLGVQLPGNIHVISKVENYKYLVGELFMAMFFWVAFIGRGYCYYCPLGTVLSFIGRAADQKIVTNNTKCIQCNKCNLACPMSIEIKGKARDGEVVKDNKCVGCAHCVDACPTKTLAYSTKFLDKVSRNKKKDKALS
ncbi:MAG: 4Fe-4S dicluster domain-containing protein [Firmicutes bacterium]|nr:4Fe-4S dicluster domain-containing protein [Bacillota bacterium]